MSNCPTIQPPSQSAPQDDLNRRRSILSRHIGEPVTFKYFSLSPRDKKLGTIVGVLVDVKRTKALVRFGPPPLIDSLWFDEPKTFDGPATKAFFGESGEWSVPLAWLVLPGSVEPAPRSARVVPGGPRR